MIFSISVEEIKNSRLNFAESGDTNIYGSFTFLIGKDEFVFRDVDVGRLFVDTVSCVKSLIYRDADSSMTIFGYDCELSFYRVDEKFALSLNHSNIEIIEYCYSKENLVMDCNNLIDSFIFDISKFENVSVPSVSRLI